MEFHISRMSSNTPPIQLRSLVVRIQIDSNMEIRLLWLHRRRKQRMH